MFIKQKPVLDLHMAGYIKGNLAVLDDPDIPLEVLVETPEWKQHLADIEKERRQKTYAGLSFSEMRDISSLLRSPGWSDQKTLVERLLMHGGIHANVRLPKSTDFRGIRNGRIEFLGTTPFAKAECQVDLDYFQGFAGGVSALANRVHLLFYPQNDYLSSFRNLHHLHDILTNLKDNFGVNFGEAYHPYSRHFIDFTVVGHQYKAPFTIDQFCTEMWESAANRRNCLRQKYIFQQKISL